MPSDTKLYYPRAILFTHKAYEVLYGEWPLKLDDQQTINAVVTQWDGRKFDGDPEKEKIARLALCEIGLRYHHHRGIGHPFAFEDVAERLREFSPKLGDSDVTLKRMDGMLADEDPQY